MSSFDIYSTVYIVEVHLTRYICRKPELDGGISTKPDENARATHQSLDPRDSLVHIVHMLLLVAGATRFPAAPDRTEVREANMVYLHMLE